MPPKSKENALHTHPLPQSGHTVDFPQGLTNNTQQNRKHLSFTAIDFETAHPVRHSICQVGLVRVENGQIVKELVLLVQPPRNFYWTRFIDIHGITPESTAYAPTFDTVWPQIEPYITDQNVVAHNGFGFDFNCLSEVLTLYNLQEPAYNKHCTYQLYRKGLATLCEEYQIDLEHHQALSDARACAVLFQRHLHSIAQNDATTKEIAE